MNEIPNCKICTLKCCGCNSYFICGMRLSLNGHRIEDCTLVVSEYYNFDKYINNPVVQICKYQKDCKNAVRAWLE